MSNKDLSPKPQNVTQDLWYYEQPKGINIVHDIKVGCGGWLRTDQIIIPWRKIIASTKRKLKK